MAEYVLPGMHWHLLEQTSENLEEGSYCGVVAAKSLMATSNSAPDLRCALPGMLSKPAVVYERLQVRRTAQL